MYESTSDEDDDVGDDEGENKSGLLDLEDLGPMMNTMKQAKVEFSWGLQNRNLKWLNVAITAMYF